MTSILSVGLTGGIASGKSAVSERLADKGAVIIDADQLARDVLAPGTEGLREVIATFGESLLDEQGALDRPALGQRVFNDEDARQQLNAIVHPRVRAEATRLREKAREEAGKEGQHRSIGQSAIVVEDIPLLVETGQAERFDVVVVVEAPEKMRIERIVEHRGMSREEAQSRITAQATDQERAEVADVVINNSGSLEELDIQIDQLWDRLLTQLRT